MADLCADEVSQLRVGLREYVDVRLEALEHRIATANQVLDVRLETMNEFRQAMLDQTAAFVTRHEFEARRDKTDLQLQSLHDFKTAINAKADQKSVYVAYIFSVIGIIFGVIGLLR